jgi:hypothetical protein
MSLVLSIFTLYLIYLSICCGRRRNANESHDFFILFDTFLLSSIRALKLQLREVESLR